MSAGAAMSSVPLLQGSCSWSALPICNIAARLWSQPRMSMPNQDLTMLTLTSYQLAQADDVHTHTHMHLGTLVPLSQFATVPESRPQEVEDGPEGSQPGDKLKRFKPLSILLPDSASTPAAPPGGSKGSGTPAGLGGGVQGAGASLTGAGQTSVQASTPGAGARAYMNGGVYLEGELEGSVYLEGVQSFVDWCWANECCKPAWGWGTREHEWGCLPS
eukprot:1157775-Pelagomonas_calceolata.AAC.20